MKVDFIKLAGQHRPVRYSFNALSEFTDITGAGWNDLIRMSNNLSFDKMRTIVYIGLKYGAKQEGVPFNETFESVGDLLESDFMQVREFSNLFYKSISKLMVGEETNNEVKTATPKATKKKAPATN